jgi:hypothetical protein
MPNLILLICNEFRHSTTSKKTFQFDSISRDVNDIIKVLITYTFRPSNELSPSFQGLISGNLRPRIHIHHRARFECLEFLDDRCYRVYQAAVVDYFCEPSELEHESVLRHDIGKQLRGLHLKKLRSMLDTNIKIFSHLFMTT